MLDPTGSSARQRPVKKNRARQQGKNRAPFSLSRPVNEAGEGRRSIVSISPSAAGLSRCWCGDMARPTATALLVALLALRAEAADPSCAKGILSGSACCPKECGKCGGPSCGTLPGGSANCCTGAIVGHRDSCENYDPPCVFHKAAPATACGDYPAALATVCLSHSGPLSHSSPPTNLTRPRGAAGPPERAAHRRLDLHARPLHARRLRR